MEGVEVSPLKPKPGLSGPPTPGGYIEHMNDEEKKPEP